MNKFVCQQHPTWQKTKIQIQYELHLILCTVVSVLTSKQYRPESKTTADNASIDVVKVIIANCSPNSAVIHFQSSFVVQRTSYQPHIWISTHGYLQTVERFIDLKNNFLIRCIDLDACENRCLRRILQICYKDKITNSEARQRTQQTLLSNRVGERWLVAWTCATYEGRKNHQKSSPVTAKGSSVTAKWKQIKKSSSVTAKWKQIKSSSVTAKWKQIKSCLLYTSPSPRD